MIREQKLHLSKYDLTNNMQELSVMNWIPKMHKNRTSF